MLFQIVTSPRPAGCSSRERRWGFGFILLATGLGQAVDSGPAWALPPYAEEWAIPGGTPEDVDVDPLGRVWVTCSDDSVRVYEPYGGQLSFAFGGTGDGDGEFHDPFGIQFAPDGTVYICDYAGARVQRFTGEGTFLLAWPIPSERADHVAVDAVGDVYVTGFPDLSVHKYDANGTPLLDWGSQAGGHTSGILVLGDVLYLGQWFASEVEQFALDGTFLGSFPIDTAYAVDIEHDGLGQLWIADWSNGVVRIFSLTGDPVDVLGEFGSGPGQFDGPVGIAFGLDGSVYIADQNNGRIQRFGDSVTGVANPIAGATTIGFRTIAPNPVRDSVTLTYAMPGSERVTLTVLDASGRRITTLQDGRVSPGDHRLTWDTRAADGQPVPSGRYFMRLETEAAVRTGAVIVMR